MDTPDLKSIPPNPQRAWEYGYSCGKKEAEEELEELYEQIDELRAMCDAYFEGWESEKNKSG